MLPFRGVQYVQNNLGTFALRMRLTRKSVCKTLRGTILNAAAEVRVLSIHFCHHWSKNLKREIGSLFDPVLINAMGWHGHIDHHVWKRFTAPSDLAQLFAAVCKYHCYHVVCRAITCMRA